MTFARIATVVTVAVVAGGVAAGFTAIGPPSRARLVGLDDRRVDDLKTIALRLRESDAPLPASLSNRPPVPRDPVTGTAYGYQKESPTTYRLCANFATAEPSDDALGSWHHPAGPACFRLARHDFAPQDAAFRPPAAR